MDQGALLPRNVGAATDILIMSLGRRQEEGNKYLEIWTLEILGARFLG